MPGRSTPLDSDQVFATEFHGEDGLGDIYAKGLHTAPTDWETSLLHDAEKEGEKHSPFQATPRDATDEILFQLSKAKPLTVVIIAIGPLTNLALAIERDPKTFSRAKSVVILGG
jgi:inosine-uridine nucleoside N-ribohydrolase